MHNQYYHLRMAPRDPRDKNKSAKVGSDGELYNPQFGELKPRVMKERSTYAGGFKIIEEGPKVQQFATFASEASEGCTSSISGNLTKDMVLKDLDIREEIEISGKIGAGLSRGGIAKEVIDDISKEINKLQRHKENLERRKEYALTGEIKEDETFEQKGERIKRGLEDEGAKVLHADPGRIQAQRHQTGQLGGLGEITLEEVRDMRIKNEERLKEIEDQYFKAKSAKDLGSAILDKFFPNVTFQKDDDGEFKTAHFKGSEGIEEPSFKYKDFSKGDAKTKLKNHKSKSNLEDVTKPYYMQGVASRPNPKIGKYKNENIDANEINDVTQNLWNAPAFYSKSGKPKNSRDAAYEAKFKRFLYNKHQKHKFDLQKDKGKKREYDTWMYGPESPHKDAKTIDWEGTDVYKKLHKTNLEDYKGSVDDEQLLRQEIEKDKNQLESLSKQDEILFNILKWIFNAIRKEKEYVNKNELVIQLEMNQQIVYSFGFGDFNNFKTQLAEFETQQEGTCTWDEFIDFFISKSGLANDKNEWWKTFLLDMDAKEKAKKELQIYNSPEQKQK